METINIAPNWVGFMNFAMNVIGDIKQPALVKAELRKELMDLARKLDKLGGKLPR